MLKLCRNSNFPHHTSNLYKGLCLACYKYQERTGKMRPASVIIAHLERTTKTNPMALMLSAVEVVKILADLENQAIRHKPLDMSREEESEQILKNTIQAAKALSKKLKSLKVQE